MAVHRIFILAVAALPFVGSAVLAQDAGRYRTWDRNNDGVITRAEWRGTIQEFRDLDGNRDGVLSGTEVRGDVWQSSDNRWDVESFVSLDRNRNGRINRGEWRGDRATFDRVDRNGDSQITRAELLNADAGSGDGLNFDALDDDNNGRIGRNEWNSTAAAFNRLDVNRDGILNRRELAASDVVLAAADDDFDALDYNNNGVISRGEWRTSVGNFNQYDQNRDGVVSRSEYASGGGGVDDERSVIIDARQPWTETGIHVNAGDIITYRADGTIQMSTDTNDRATPAGSLKGRNAKNSPRPDQRAGGLLVRIGGSPVLFLGDNGSFTAQNSGRLSLGVNDDHFPDNSGEYRVWLTVDGR